MAFAINIAVPTICAFRFHPINYFKPKEILAPGGKEVIRLEVGAQETLLISFPWIPRTTNIERLATALVTKNVNIVPGVTSQGDWVSFKNFRVAFRLG